MPYSFAFLRTKRQWQTSQLRKHRGEGNSSHLQASQGVDSRRYELYHGDRDVLKQVGVGLEKIFVEVLVALRAGPQRKFAGDVRRIGG